MPETMTFGAELRRLRGLILGGNDRPMTAADLAWVVDKSPQYINDLEHGRRKPALAIVRALTVVFGHSGIDCQHLRELAFKARGECCPRCGFGSGTTE